MRSLVMSPFSCDYMKTEIDSLKYIQQCFNLLTCARYSHSPWFLDGKTSIFAFKSHFDGKSTNVTVYTYQRMKIYLYD